jgi:cyclophilin family peptidyl-prolyl cis-trans isomerase
MEYNVSQNKTFRAEETLRKLAVSIAVLAICCGAVASAADAPKKGGKPVVLLETSMGNIKVELYPDKAPITVANFLAYVKDGHYDGLIFHRVIRDFMIQGGGFTPDMNERRPPRPPIRNEAGTGLKNDRGTIAMARTMVVDSATAQFFINSVNNDFLNHRDETPRGFGYAVFGKVIEGMDTVDKIRSVPTGSQDIPKTTITIIKATVLQTDPR